jgi:acetylornithine deacetylase/succinyl-diaminopimelate desuccinylase-like protein
MTVSNSLSEAQVSQVTDAVTAAFPNAIGTLGDLVRIPGIAWDAFDPQNLELSASKVAELLQETGVFDWVEIRKAPVAAEYGDKLGAPAVVARRAAKNGAPQILLYAHHDVQPPGDATIWKTPEFQPTVIDGRMYGRGAADDKAGIVAHLAAINTLKEIAGSNFDLGITCFIEGEEEAGSPSFRNFLEANAQDLKSDVIIVADSGNFTTEIPGITTTLRGLVSQVIEVRTLDHAVHSGMFGGVVPDAMTATIRLLASLHDERGNVAVAGLHSSKAAELPLTEDMMRADSGLLDGVQFIGEGSLTDRNWTKPAITVIGIDGQTVALSSNTMLPSVKAKISMRIAPGEQPERALQLLRDHLTANLPWGAKLEFHETEKGKPYQVSDGGWAKPLLEEALGKAYGHDSVDLGIGGSIPFIADLVELFPAAQILVTGVEDPDSRAHSPNESVHLGGLKNAMVAEALLLLGSNSLKN